MDESIKSYEYDEYQPVTGTQPNSVGQITITIENQGQFLDLHKNNLLIEGDVSKADNARCADDDLVALTNNGLFYLFSSLKLTLVNYSGQATSLLGIASYSSTFSNGCALTEGWYPDTNTNAAVNKRHSNPKGSFQCAIPMRQIFGFVDAYS